MAIVEGFLAAFLTVLLEKMASGKFLKFARYQGMHTLLSNWSNMLSKIQAVLIDAEEKQMPDPAVNLWLDDLHDLAYDLDDVLDEFATEALRQKLMEDPTPQASSSKVTGCPSLTYLGGVPTTLKHLKIWWCEKLEQLLVEEVPKIGYPLLEYVDIWHCQSLKYLPEGWLPLTSLQRLATNSCPAGGGIVSYFIDKGNFLTNLTSLSISNIKTSKPPSEWNFHKFSSLIEFRIGGAVIVQEEYLEVSSFPMDGMLLPSSLIKLCIWSFSNLESLSSKGFENLNFLESLFIGDCPRLASFPEQGLPTSLLHLCIYECPILKQQCETDEYWPLVACIPCVKIDGRSIFDSEEEDK